jgi:dTDP-4-amino-4,6-dideoxygalactose transaminase
MFRLPSELAKSGAKADFIRKVNAEGIPVSAGYVPLNANKAIIEATKTFAGEERVYACPVCERVCEEVVWLGQAALLAEEKDMYDIEGAVRKVLSAYD